jgi:hypothetical protein
MTPLITNLNESESVARTKLSQGSERLRHLALKSKNHLAI